MDVFGELDVELLAVEIEAEQSFVTDGLGADGIIPEAQITSEVAQLEAGQAFDEFSDLSSFTSNDMPQNLDGQSLNAEWLDAFVNADDGASLDTKDDLVLMDDEEEDNIDVWGVHNADDYDSTYTSPGYNTSYDGDAPNPNGPPGGDGTDEDEVIVTAQINPRAAEIAASLSIVHNSDGTTTYTLEGVEFTNESEWLEAILDALIDAFADDNDGLGGTVLGILVNALLGPAAQAIFDALPADGQRWFLYDVFGIILPE